MKTSSALPRLCGPLAFALSLSVVSMKEAAAQQKPPNIVVIMGDDVGWFNIDAYHRGMMSTDCYAEAS
jgi:hypothetical protein